MRNSVVDMSKALISLLLLPGSQQIMESFESPRSKTFVFKEETQNTASAIVTQQKDCPAALEPPGAVPPVYLV